MPTYRLNIQFDQAGLDTLNEAGQSVTIVKSVPQGVPVAWISFAPLLNNLVTWNEQYSVYASTSQIQDGTEIFTQSTQAAAGGSTYKLVAGHFDSGTSGLLPNTYGVVNADPGFQVGGIQKVTSGLYQGASVDGTPAAAAINAVAVPYLDEAVFTPIEKVQIFASSFQNNGLVISSAVPSQALEVDLADTPTQALHYNSEYNRFTLGPLSRVG
jgi:hypothetical protein